MTLELKNEDFAKRIFEIGWTVSEIWLDGSFQDCQVAIWNLATLQNLDVIAENRCWIRIQHEKISHKQRSFCLLFAQKRFYVKNRRNLECEIALFFSRRNLCRDISLRPFIRFQK